MHKRIKAIILSSFIMSLILLMLNHCVLNNEFDNNNIDIQKGTFTDSRDNIVYDWVKIGNQTWMAENLKYLTSVVSPVTASFTEPCSYVYGYNDTNVIEARANPNYSEYGVLYNWPAVMAGSSSSTANPSGVKGICPDGWHLPSDAEWTQLELLLWNNSNVGVGCQLKESGFTHWSEYNTGGTNESGFSALPGGVRDSDSTFRHIGNGGLWWNTAECSDTLFAWSSGILSYSCELGRARNEKNLGFSVRCLKD
jgi:uncharacterized protein (TIGR02145 family)